MAFCSKCGNEIPEGTAFCAACGTPIGGVAPAAPVIAPNNHTAEFEAEDIELHKTFALLCYLAGPLGILLTFFGAKDSAFANFHAKQAMKVLVITVLAGLVCAIPFLGWFCGGVVICILLVCNLIQFFRVCAGKSFDYPILCNFGFLGK